MEKKLKVIDFFCGAGGFSEGFRQQGFDVVMGIDNWLPAIQTHNLNHNLADTPRDVLDFNNSIEEIEKLPDTEVIVGSPPCVLFSLSNKGGKADKTLGLRLIESFLRVVAVKKYKPKSKLKAWFMENVPNSKNYVRKSYTFRQLNLTDWAKVHNLDPDQIALNGSVNGSVLNTVNFGVSQKRERFVCGEIVATGKFPDLSIFLSDSYKSISDIKHKMPKPNIANSKKIFVDPNYPSLEFRANQLTDHFYDSGVYQSQWKKAQYLKLNHPFMGKMSFPENENNPSRTIMATQSASTRESLLYKSEYKRLGDGEYRLPTVREIATLMGFPYSYQFCGSETTKWRQIGNAVCPPMSAALAKSVRLSLNLKVIPQSKITFEIHNQEAKGFLNLNTFSEKIFDKPPKMKSNARFRRHPFKEGNMTVALTNFNPLSEKVGDTVEWNSSIFVGSGKNFVIRVLPKSHFKDLGKLIESHHKVVGKRFIKDFDRKFKQILGQTSKFQGAYVSNMGKPIYEPSQIIDEISRFIDSIKFSEINMNIPNLVPGKEQVPAKQVYAMYAINKIIS